MDLSIQVYDKVVLITVSGEFKSEDVLTFDQELPAIYTGSNAVVVSFSASVKTQEPLFSALTKLRDKHNHKKQKLLYTHPSFKAADYPEPRAALEFINTAETLRVADILKAEVDFAEVGKQLSILDKQYDDTLRKAVGAAASDAVLTDSEREKMQVVLKDRLKKLHYLYRTLGSEIENIEKERKKAGSIDQPPEDAQQRVESARKSASKAMKAAGML